MTLKTNRLTLRPFKESDAEALYQHAKCPEIGPMAGWPAHTSVEDSREIIKSVLCDDETYAIVLVGSDSPVGCIDLKIGDKSHFCLNADEGEIGYWIGKPYWGQGLIPEAVRRIMRYGFTDMKLTKLWCGYFDGNEKSRRVQEKCGFKYHHTEASKLWPMINQICTEHVTCIAKSEWEKLFYQT